MDSFPTQVFNSMKTLKDHVILYDQDCPLCNAYTGAFVKTGMLDHNGRQPFSQADQHIKSLIDHERASDEIALIDMKTGSVRYGIDSLFKILAHRFPVLRCLFSSPLFRACMSKLYFFVSYNRKIVAPGKQFESPTSCTPSFNLKYRWAFILFAWLITSLVLTSYVGHLIPLLPPTTLGREFIICGGQLAFQGIILLILNRKRTLHYLGNMMTVSLIGALLLLPAIILGNLNVIQTPYFFLGWFGLVVCFMLAEHKRRATILGLPLLVSGTWVFYRVLVLFLIYSL